MSDDQSRRGKGISFVPSNVGKVRGEGISFVPSYSGNSREAKSSTKTKRTSSNREIPIHLLCPLSGRIMTDPVVCNDGHTYERQEIEKWFSLCARQGNNPISPMTKQDLNNDDLFANMHAKAMISQFLEDNPWISSQNTKPRNLNEKLKRELVDAIRGGDFEKIKRMVGADGRFLDTVLVNGQIALDIVIRGGKRDIFRSVVDLHSPEQLGRFKKGLYETDTKSFVEYCVNIHKNLGTENLQFFILDKLSLSQEHCRKCFLLELEKRGVPEILFPLVSPDNLSINEKLIFENFVLRKKLKELRITMKGQDERLKTLEKNVSYLSDIHEKNKKLEKVRDEIISTMETNIEDHKTKMLKLKGYVAQQNERMSELEKKLEAPRARPVKKKKPSKSKKAANRQKKVSRSFQNSEKPKPNNRNQERNTTENENRTGEYVTVPEGKGKSSSPSKPGYMKNSRTHDVGGYVQDPSDSKHNQGVSNQNDGSYGGGGYVQDPTDGNVPGYDTGGYKQNKYPAKRKRWKNSNRQYTRGKYSRPRNRNQSDDQGNDLNDYGGNTGEYVQDGSAYEKPDLQGGYRRSWDNGRQGGGGYYAGYGGQY